MHVRKYKWKAVYVHVSTMLPFAFLFYPDWHESDKAFDEACQAEVTLSHEVLQRPLNSFKAK